MFTYVEKSTARIILKPYQNIKTQLYFQAIFKFLIQLDTSEHYIFQCKTVVSDFTYIHIYVCIYIYVFYIHIHAFYIYTYMYVYTYMHFEDIFNLFHLI